MSEITKCPKCSGEYVYFDGSLYVCPDCGHEFNEEDASAVEVAEVPRDSNGAEPKLSELAIRGKTLL